MVDETKAPDVAAPAPAVDTAAPATTSEIPSISASSDTSSTPAASPEAASSSAEKPVAEAPKAETHADGVLGAEPVTTEKKVDAPSAAKAPEAKIIPDGEKPAEAPKVELPTYEEFKLPENLKLEKEPLDAFTKILGEIETGKLDHKSMQEKGQALVDLATKATVDSIARMNDSYVEIHKQNVKARLDALKADPDLGGENFEKTVSTLQETVRTYGGTEAQIAEFRKEITETGLSASPAVCRLIHNMQQKINKYTTEQNGPSIVPGAKPAPTKVKPYEAFYRGGAA